MRMGIACSLVMVLAGLAQAQGLRVCVMDAEPSKPIAGATVERWASQWQPRILRSPGKFWFPEGRSATDAGGLAAINKVAQMAHNGLAQTIRPAHTMFDGDTVFALALGPQSDTRQDQVSLVSLIGAAAAITLARAIIKAIRHATALHGVPAAHPSL